jgi:putative transposase
MGISYRKGAADAISSIDLGVKCASMPSSGQSIEAPGCLRAALRRLKICGRRISRKLEVAKVTAGRGQRDPSEQERNRVHLHALPR